MAINPINSIGNIANTISQTNSASNATTNTSFKNVLEDAINQVEQTDAVTKQDTIKIATGNADDLHNIMINNEKADLALQLLVQMRNKAVDAYSEIMRINL